MGPLIGSLVNPFWLEMTVPGQTDDQAVKEYRATY